MGFLSRLFGERPSHHRSPRYGTPTGGSADEQALARYRYLLRTAPPDAIEQAHAEAFARLTPEQRAQVLRELSGELSPGERAAFGNRADPQALARIATRAEVRRPGTLERAFGGGGMGRGMGMGMGGMLAGSLLSSIAGTFIGTAIAHQFLDGFDGDFGGDSGDVDTASADSWGDSGDSGYGDSGGDYGGDSFGGGDFGGDIEL